MLVAENVQPESTDMRTPKIKQIKIREYVNKFYLN